ncbi:MAG: hypothetical protein ABIG89_06420 [Candidatus Woesearchaeota archaeon]
MKKINNEFNTDPEDDSIFERDHNGIHMPDIVDNNDIFYLKSIYGFLIISYIALGVLIVVG